MPYLKGYPEGRLHCIKGCTLSADSLSSPLDMTKSDVRPTPALVVASPDSKKQSPRVLDTDMEHRVESRHQTTPSTTHPWNLK